MCTNPVVCTYLVFVSWKSTLIIALDACFKLKLKNRSFNDPDLGTRLAYMVNDNKYQLHLSQCPKDPPPDEVRWSMLTVTRRLLTPLFPGPHLRFKAARSE